jgi:hypothetical protein
MLANPDIGVTQIAHRLGASPATLYGISPPRETANYPAFENGAPSPTHERLPCPLVQYSYTLPSVPT